MRFSLCTLKSLEGFLYYSKQEEMVAKQNLTHVKKQIFENDKKVITKTNLFFVIDIFIKQLCPSPRSATKIGAQMSEKYGITREYNKRK